MLKHIVLNTAATDCLGGYHDAGSELAVGEQAEAGMLSTEKAHELIENGRAVSKTAALAAAVADDLDGKSLTQLHQVAKTEGVDVETDANKPTIVAAIRAKRSAQA